MKNSYNMTKSDKNNTTKSGYKKLKKLRKRLQYKKREETLEAVEDNLHNEKEKVKRKQEFFNRASPMPIVKLYKHQNESHRHIISLNGFGSFLGIKCSKLHPALCNFLMSSFNTETCELEFPGRGSIPITDGLVNIMLGIPIDKFPVVYQTDEEAIAIVMANLDFGDGHQPKLADVKEKLKQMELGDARYLMLWVIYVVCSMLAPTTAVYISSKIYPAVMDPTRIKDLNWCRFVIQIIIQTARAKDRKNQFKACMPLMMITYIDSLETRDINVPTDGPRICAWDNKSVANAIAQDTNPDGSFGRLQLKKIYRKNKVLLLSTLARIQKFVKDNVPRDCGEEEMERYRTATRQMYSEIDMAVAKFLKRVTKDKNSPHQPKITQMFKATRKTPRQNKQHPMMTDTLSSRSKKKYLQEKMLQSSSEDEADDRDGDYVEEQPGYQTDLEDTSLDEESFDCKNNEDDDFTAPVCPRKDLQPIRKSRWFKQPTTVPVRATMATVKNKKRKDKAGHTIVITETRPIQIREPPVCTVQHNVRSEAQVSIVGQGGAQTSNINIHEQMGKRKICDTRTQNDGNSPSKADDAVHKKPRVVDDEQTTQDTTSDKNVKATVSPTCPSTIGTRGNQNEGYQVDNKQPVIDPLEHLKVYNTDSQSSNDVDQNEGSKSTDKREKMIVRDVLRSCLKKRIESVSTVHDKECITEGTTAKIASVAHIPDSKTEASGTVPKTDPSLAKKTVSWAIQEGTEATLDATPVNNIESDASMPTKLPKFSPPTFCRGSLITRLMSPLKTVLSFATPVTKSMSPLKPVSSRARPVTRSMSPLKPLLSSATQISSSVTRSISSANPLIILNEGLSIDKTRSPVVKVSSSKQTKSPAITRFEETTPLFNTASNIADDSMSRKLDFGSIERENTCLRWEPGEAPSFDLGFEEPSESKEVKQNEDTLLGLLVITSSNEDKLYGPAEEYEMIWNSMSEKNIPTETCSSVHTKRCIVAGTKSTSTQTYITPIKKEENKVAAQIDASHDPDSKTPVPQAHQKRVVKPTKAQMSPFIQHERNKETTITKSIKDVYNSVCKHGLKSNSELKERIIIDYGELFIYLADLADSVKPEGWLSNSTCEVALHVLAHEMAAQKKFVMPLIISKKLREGTFHTKDIKKVFAFSETNRLDHKEQIVFPVLQDLSSVKDVMVGHYYLINLNLKAERFEIMDSLRKDGDKMLMQDSSKNINSIKVIWSQNYGLSKIKIDNFETIHIQVPKQLTTYNCGYFMLKFIEYWDGRKMVSTFNQMLLPKFRMLFTRKWLQWSGNQIHWDELLFPD